MNTEPTPGTAHAAFGPIAARTAAVVVWTGGAALGLATLAALWLTVSAGERVFAARLLAGLAGCL